MATKTIPQAGYVCVFAKPPQPGAVKTRLAAAIGEIEAAQLAAAFLQDTWSGVTMLSWARPILATTAVPASDSNFCPEEQTWLQGDGDLGQRLERIMQRALRSSEFVMAIGADTPGLPTSLFEQARTALAQSDAVLGPCDDGGFYLIGLTRCPSGLLADLPWSTDRTCASTEARLRERGLSVALIDPWFDVDRLDDLVRLRRMIELGEVVAPTTLSIVAGRPLVRPAEEQQ